MISVSQLPLRAVLRTGLLSLALLGFSAAAQPAIGSAATPPAAHFAISSSVSPTHLIPGDTTGSGTYVVTVENTGAAPTDGSAITIEPTLPAGVTAHTGTTSSGFVYFQGATDGELYDCELGPPITCTAPGLTLQPGQRYYAAIALDVPANTPNPALFSATVSGGGVPAASTTLAAAVSATSASLGFQSAFASANGLAGDPATQAGSHPYALRLGFQLNTFQTTFKTLPVAPPKDLLVRLPHGYVLNPRAVPQACTEAQVALADCPDSAAVGVIHVHAGQLGFVSPAFTDPIYRMVNSPGTPAEFAFSVKGWAIVTHIRGGVDSAGDYALTGDVSEFPGFGSISGAEVEFWGDPSDPSHDAMRGGCAYHDASDNLPGCPVTQQQTPLLTLPSACSDPLPASFDIDPWDVSQGHYSTSVETTEDQGNPIGVSGCSALDFQPTLEARPTTNVADSPSGLDVDLRVPQNNDVNTLATANLKDATVTLPPGLVVNPSAANGLQGCSSAQIGLATPIGQTPIRFDAAHAACPDAAKLGSAEVDTPLLENPLPGTVYIADPYDNPFHSLLALYIVIDDPATGVIVKLAGHVEPDPNTGQLSATFSENPELPFEDFKLSFYGGAAGALRTPATCGTYTTTSSLTPWSAPDSGPPATPADEYAISQAPGGSCHSSDAELPNTPSMDAGTITPIAGAYSPLVVNLRREDGTQQFSAVTLTPPPGLVGKLAGLATCSDSALAAAAAKTGAQEEANPSCPAASRVGTVAVGAGAGPAPYYAKGAAYMTGPYKGAPLSLAIVTPATAGPFDLGTVVVRTALFIDPRTAAITAKSDPLPTILQGIPLDIRSAQIKVDRPQFSLNPTSCDPTSFGAQLTSTLSQVSLLSSRFQLGECGSLGFKPRMTLRLKGGTKRGKYPALTATLESRAGDANLASISVALPHSEFLAQEHIGTVCTRVQFAAHQCPPASVYGEATVTTPLLDYQLTGPVYLRSSSNPLPDLVPDLHGPADQPIELEASGRTDSIHGGLRNTFDFVPDAPFTKLVLSMEGGKKGLLVNSTNICKTVNRATIKYSGHNGALYEGHPPLKAHCPKPKKRKHKAHHHAHRRNARG